MEVIKNGEIKYSTTDLAIINLISDSLSIEAERVIPTAKFLDDLGADSLDIVELLMALEELLDCEIPDEQAEKILTVGDVLKYCADNNLTV